MVDVPNFVIKYNVSENQRDYVAELSRKKSLLRKQQLILKLIRSR